MPQRMRDSNHSELSEEVISQLNGRTSHIKYRNIIRFVFGIVLIPIPLYICFSSDCFDDGDSLLKSLGASIIVYIGFVVIDKLIGNKTHHFQKRKMGFFSPTWKKISLTIVFFFLTWFLSLLCFVIALSGYLDEPLSPGIIALYIPFIILTWPLIPNTPEEYSAMKLLFLILWHYTMSCLILIQYPKK